MKSKNESPKVEPQKEIRIVAIADRNASGLLHFGFLIEDQSL